jgi:hypothetical protein
MQPVPALSKASLHPSDLFHLRLSMYALAAGATGVTMLALAKPASGEIVYTPTNIVIGAHGTYDYELDLNQDGVIDFNLETVFRESVDTSGGTQKLLAKPVRGNAVVGYAEQAAPINSGEVIGFIRNFAGKVMATDVAFVGSTYPRGKWLNLTNRYLGLKFQISGQTHFGWARLSVTAVKGFGLQATLTGYAYETTANLAIVAGQTTGQGTLPIIPKGSSSRSGGETPTATLGALAAGAQSISIWRREESAAEE